MENSLLSGLRALDLTDKKGFICGKILATLGVETIKIEKPGGDPGRLIPPLISSIPGSNESLFWLAYNTDKRGITLNLETQKGQDLFRRLVKGADFVIESFTPGFMDGIGLGFSALKKENPGIVMASITPFGQKGPHAHYKGGELIASATSGILATNGDADRPPVKEGPDSIHFESNAAAALGAVIAYYHRATTGQGQHVDVSMQEVAAKRTTTNMVVWEFDKRLIKRNGTLRTFGARATNWIWPCKDGYVFWTFLGGKFGAPANRAISQWIEDERLENPLREISNWDEFDMAAVPQESLDNYQAAIAKLFMNYTKKEINEEGLKRGINACVVNNPADIRESQQLRARDYWVALEHAELGITFSYPKHYFLCSRTENFVRHRAPNIGEDNEAIYTNELGLSRAEIAALKEERVI